ncbi:MAG: beta-propeller fold lactonase family protein [Clostridia bacterium]|nr:beta-propeller fold lactonase family protein [Clostridia bacterium]
MDTRHAAKDRQKRTGAILIGTYTTPSSGDGSRSKGIYRVRARLNSQGQIELDMKAELALRAEDPSYLLPVEGGLFYVDEGLGKKEGQVVYAQMEGRKYSVKWALPTGGENPCHLALSQDERWLAVANYTSGSVMIVELDGRQVMRAQLFPGHHGSVNPARQEGPHAHFTYFVSPEELLTCDLGADEIRRFQRTQDTWEETAPFARLPEGSGPRHFVRTDAWMYVICELSREIIRLDLGGRVVDRKAILPGKAEGTAAAIRLFRERDREGRERDVVYCTHRGKRKSGDQWASMKVQKKGNLTRQWKMNTGRCPRDLLKVGNLVLCACQEEHAVVISAILGDLGVWAPLKKISVSSPVCLAWEQGTELKPVEEKGGIDT